MIKEDWIECTFEHVLEIKNGKNQKQVENVNGKYPIYGSSGIIGKANDYLCEENSIIIGRKGTINSPILVTTKFWNVDTAFGLTPFPFLNSRLLYYFCINFNFHTLDKSTTIPSLTKTDLLKIKFDLPPVPIQRALVRKMEKLFSELDASIADLKLAQEQLKVYRLSVLEKAFEGTNPLIALGKLITRIEAGKSFRCKEVPPENNEIGVLKVSSITWGEFNEMESKTVVDHSKINQNYFVKKGDFLLSRANTIDLVGNSVIVREISKTLMLSDKTLRLVFTKNIDKEYILYFLRTKSGRQQIMSLSTGNQESMRNISQNNIKEIRIPLPSIDQQLQIVKYIKSNMSVCDVLEKKLVGSLQRSQAIRQSILKKAFAGELLTLVELAACRKEPDYEPASILFERFNTEKERASIGSKKEEDSKEGKLVANAPGITTDLHAGLIAKLIKLHEAHSAHKDKLNHVKCEKVAHLVEYHVKISLGRYPVKDAAGPDDYPHLKKIESRAIKAGFFKIRKNQIGYTYLPGNQIDKVIQRFESSLSTDQSIQVNSLLRLFLQFDFEQAEIAVTTYAGWNNLIILGNSSPSDEEIVTESRENWSARKLKIPRERFFNAINWLRKKEVNLIPTGYGLLVKAPSKKKK